MADANSDIQEIDSDAPLTDEEVLEIIQAYEGEFQGHVVESRTVLTLNEHEVELNFTDSSCVENDETVTLKVFLHPANVPAVLAAIRALPTSRELYEQAQTERMLAESRSDAIDAEVDAAFPE